VLGNPLGSPELVEAYLFAKGVKHMPLLSFIQDVDAAGFPRELWPCSQGLQAIASSASSSPSKKPEDCVVDAGDE
jgi:hypothetical protein